ncbi:hypothetical protein ABZY81_36310 [Streptomyces sp. NPDC006514]|uniref:hypothetical protein n=1 Tax=Streptomyces sp. NPDC006514 TaxID=3154308 RepID=UPI0033B6A997
MTHRSNQAADPHSAEPPHHETVLERTDWASLATPYGTGASLPAALARLIDPDPRVREAAVHNALGGVTHQNSIYEATMPVALYAAAILDHPVLAEDGFRHDDATSRGRPTLVSILDWLGETAYDADGTCVAVDERTYGEGSLDEEMRAFRELRPVIFSAVRALLGHDHPEVRNTALVAAIPLIEHPALTVQSDLTGHAHRLLATSTDRYHRDRVLDALKAWGHDTTDLEGTRPTSRPANGTPPSEPHEVPGTVSGRATAATAKTRRSDCCAGTSARGGRRRP